jgi:hypothetical protein
MAAAEEVRILVGATIAIGVTILFAVSLLRGMRD